MSSFAALRYPALDEHLLQGSQVFAPVCESASQARRQLLEDKTENDDILQGYVVTVTGGRITHYERVEATMNKVTIAIQRLEYLKSRRWNTDPDTTVDIIEQTLDGLAYLTDNYNDSDADIAADIILDVVRGKGQISLQQALKSALTVLKAGAREENPKQPWLIEYENAAKALADIGQLVTEKNINKQLRSAGKGYEWVVESHDKDKGPGVNYMAKLITPTGSRKGLLKSRRGTASRALIDDLQEKFGEKAESKKSTGGFAAEWDSGFGDKEPKKKGPKKKGPKKVPSHVTRAGKKLDITPEHVGVITRAYSERVTEVGPKDKEVLKIKREMLDMAKAIAPLVPPFKQKRFTAPQALDFLEKWLTEQEAGKEPTIKPSDDPEKFAHSCWEQLPKNLAKQDALLGLIVASDLDRETASAIVRKATPAPPKKTYTDAEKAARKQKQLDRLLGKMEPHLEMMSKDSADYIRKQTRKDFKEKMVCMPGAGKAQDSIWVRQGPRIRQIFEKLNERGAKQKQKQLQWKVDEYRGEQPVGYDKSKPEISAVVINELRNAEVCKLSASPDEATFHCGDEYGGYTVEYKGLTVTQAVGRIAKHVKSILRDMPKEEEKPREFPAKVEADTTENTMYLVACVGKKGTSEAEAQDLYLSPWFRKARAYVKSMKTVPPKPSTHWRILSAKHGLIKPTDRIKPYNVTLNEMKAHLREKWQTKVLAEIRKQAKALDVKRIVFLAGESYRKGLVSELTKDGYQVEVPMKGLSIGQQLKWLTDRLPKTAKPAKKEKAPAPAKKEPAPATAPATMKARPMAVILHDKHPGASLTDAGFKVSPTGRKRKHAEHISYHDSAMVLRCDVNVGKGDMAPGAAKFLASKVSKTGVVPLLLITACGQDAPKIARATAAKLKAGKIVGFSPQHGVEKLDEQWVKASGKVLFIDGANKLTKAEIERLEELALAHKRKESAKAKAQEAKEKLRKDFAALKLKPGEWVRFQPSFAAAKRGRVAVEGMVHSLVTDQEGRYAGELGVNITTEGVKRGDAIPDVWDIREYATDGRVVRLAPPADKKHADVLQNAWAFMIKDTGRSGGENIVLNVDSSRYHPQSQIAEMHFTLEDDIPRFERVQMDKSGGNPTWPEDRGAIWWSIKTPGPRPQDPPGTWRTIVRWWYLDKATQLHGDTSRIDFVYRLPAKSKRAAMDQVKKELSPPGGISFEEGSDWRMLSATDAKKRKTAKELESVPDDATKFNRKMTTLGIKAEPVRAEGGIPWWYLQIRYRGIPQMDDYQPTKLELVVMTQATSKQKAQNAFKRMLPAEKIKFGKYSDWMILSQALARKYNKQEVLDEVPRTQLDAMRKMEQLAKWKQLTYEKYQRREAERMAHPATKAPPKLEVVPPPKLEVVPPPKLELVPPEMAVAPIDVEALKKELRAGAKRTAAHLREYGMELTTKIKIPGYTGELGYHGEVSARTDAKGKYRITNGFYQMSGMGFTSGHYRSQKALLNEFPEDFRISQEWDEKKARWEAEGILNTVKRKAETWGWTWSERDPLTWLGFQDGIDFKVAISQEQDEETEVIMTKGYGLASRVVSRSKFESLDAALWWLVHWFDKNQSSEPAPGLIPKIAKAESALPALSGKPEPSQQERDAEMMEGILGRSERIIQRLAEQESTKRKKNPSLSDMTTEELIAAAF